MTSPGSALRSPSPSAKESVFVAVMIGATAAGETTKGFGTAKAVFRVALADASGASVRPLSISELFSGEGVEGPLKPSAKGANWLVSSMYVSRLATKVLKLRRWGFEVL